MEVDRYVPDPACEIPNRHYYEEFWFGDLPGQFILRRFGNKVQVAENKKNVGLDSFQKLIDSDVDLVLLATSPAIRPSHFEAVVNAGKSIFCEKPFAVDVPGLKELKEEIEIF